VTTGYSTASAMPATISNAIAAASRGVIRAEAFRTSGQSDVGYETLIVIKTLGLRNCYNIVIAGAVCM